MLSVIPKIQSREWDIVCQLAVQMKATVQQDGTDECIKFLLDRAQRARRDTRANILSFVARSLEFLYPTPDVRRLVVKSCLNLIVEEAAKDIEIRAPDDFDKLRPRIRVIQEVLPALVSASEETVGTIKEEVRKILCFLLSGGGDNSIGAAHLILSKGMHTDPEISINPEAEGELSRLIKFVQKDCHDSLAKALMQNIYLTALAVTEDIVAVEDAIKIFGLDIINAWSKLVFVSAWRVPIAYMLFHQLLLKKDPAGSAKAAVSVEIILNYLLQAPIPWNEVKSDPFFIEISSIAHGGRNVRMPRKENERSVLVLLTLYSLPGFRTPSTGNATLNKLDALVQARNVGDVEYALEVCRKLSLPERVQEKVAAVIAGVPR